MAWKVRGGVSRRVRGRTLLSEGVTASLIILNARTRRETTSTKTRARERISSSHAPVRVPILRAKFEDAGPRPGRPIYGGKTRLYVTHV